MQQFDQSIRTNWRYLILQMFKEWSISISYKIGKTLVAELQSSVHKLFKMDKELATPGMEAELA